MKATEANIIRRLQKRTKSGQLKQHSVIAAAVSSAVNDEISLLLAAAKTTACKQPAVDR